MSSLKDILRGLCPPFIWNGLRFMTGRGGHADGKGSRYHGLLELDRKIERHVDFDNGFFVEIGGWDGISFSNTLYFERHRNWRGMLIEPTANQFLACRASRPDALVVCRACVPFDYPDRFLPMTYCGLMTAARSSEHALNDLPDFDGHIESGVKFLRPEETVFEFGALATPLSTVFDEYEVDRTIDLLVLDVEGFEISVLKGLDFGRHAPRYICVESHGRDEIEAFLGERGYRLLEQLSFMDNRQDYLFARE